MAVVLVVKLFVQLVLLFTVFDSFQRIVIAQDTTPCVCDLTSNACDFNCCCDKECEQADRDAFKECSDADNNQDNRVCISSSLIYFHNTPYASENTGNGLFCIIRDNYAERNYYQEVSPVTDFSAALSSASQRGFSISTQSEISYSKDSVYKMGNRILLVYVNGVHGYLSLPKAVTTDVCDDNNPAGFFVQENSSCIRMVTSWSQDCNTTNQISPSYYYKDFKIVTTPSALSQNNGSYLYRSVNSTVLLNITCAQSDNTTCDNIETPYYDEGTNTCRNVIKEVDYTVLYSTSDSLVITEVRVTFTLVNITANPSTSLEQKFSIKFQKEGIQIPVKRSGNPGYQHGKPLIVGSLSADGKTINSTGLLTLPVPSVECDSNRTESSLTVDFGIFVSTGCLINVQTGSTTCEDIQNIAFEAMTGTAGSLTHVAMFGNSDTNNVDDWIKIINNKPSNKAQGTLMSCSDMVLGMSIKVLYGNVGYISNPQPKIVGVMYDYDETQTILQQFVGAYSTLPSTLTFEVKVAVSFVDVSAEPENQFKPAPQFESKAPYDFFYPFV